MSDKKVKMFADIVREIQEDYVIETGTLPDALERLETAVELAFDAHALELAEIREEVERLKKLNKCDCGRDMCQCENDE